MANKDYSIKQEQVARFAKAMGHPARIAILQFLAKQSTCYFGDIHEELPIAKATVSQHLKELKDAGLIQGEVETPKVKYCINRDNWRLAQELFGEFFCECDRKKESCCG
ncbi:MAG: winged helix-turn-helix transcriptional regulator [Bacteroidales bacterium]|nr:winged helix-turn-helix transcriptional regulator [Bacteroidales bacterium]